MWTDNPERDFEMHEAEQERKLAELPVCDDCGEPIQDDHYYDIDDYKICLDCLKKYKRDTEPEY